MFVQILLYVCHHTHIGRIGIGTVVNLGLQIVQVCQQAIQGVNVCTALQFFQSNLVSLNETLLCHYVQIELLVVVVVVVTPASKNTLITPGKLAHLHKTCIVDAVNYNLKVAVFFRYLLRGIQVN